MNSKLLLVLLLLFSSLALAQISNLSPIQVVQKQLDAYNAHEIDAFVDIFDLNAEIFMNLGDTTPTLKGHKEIRQLYGNMFVKNPQNKSTLMGRMVQGDYVFDHEWVTGREQPFKIMAIYEVKNGLITRAWFVR